MRPLCALRYFVRFGLSMGFRLPRLFPRRFARRRLAPRPIAARGLRLRRALVLRHRVMGQNLALEDPDLDAAGAVGRLRRAVAEIDIGAQRVQRHAAFAVPFHARDLGAAEAAGAVDPDALRAEAHRRLHGALHRPTERDAPLQLLGDAVGDQLRLDLGLADLDDVEADLALRHLGEIAAQLLDIDALLADDDARARGMDGDARLLRGALDDDAADAGLSEAAVEKAPEAQILVQQPAIVAPREPPRIPGTSDAEPQAGGMELLTHGRWRSYSSAASARSRTMTVRLLKCFSTRAARPRPRAWNRFMPKARPTVASLT